MARPGKDGLPSRDALIRFIEENPGQVGKREIARAFGVKGNARLALKELIRDLRRQGRLNPAGKRRLIAAGRLPAVLPIEIHAIDVDGELSARPITWEEAEPPPKILVLPTAPGVPALGVGDRALARLKRLPDGSYEGAVMRLLEARPEQIIGVFERDAVGGLIRPTDRRARGSFVIEAADCGGAEPGEFVLAERAGQRRRGGERVRVIERLGHVGEPGAASLLAIHTHGIPTHFPAAALTEADAARGVSLGARTDLSALPLITIDGPDARDFDDAVFAEPDLEPGNPDGFHLTVAIADVAFYVREGSALDRAARERGNSVYFPDRVVPMLPEALSNDLCSLRPDEARACLAAQIRIDAQGNILSYRFLRALLRSRARLTYEQVQRAADGRLDAASAPLLDGTIRPLYGVYRALHAARARRGALDLDLPERKVFFGPDGTISRIAPEPRYDSHRLIEECMIAANVCAALMLEERRTPCVYRVHDRPDPAKLENLRGFLAELGLKLQRTTKPSPTELNAVLAKAAAGRNAHLVNLVVLRAQAQAVYSPTNIGHFGLGLSRYAHFTSPIRRYADLLVHRALISALALGADGLAPETSAGLVGIAQHISATERRAQLAERDALERYLTAFLADRVGARFAGRVAGVTRFGLFVELDETGANGLIPASTLGHGRPRHDAERHVLAIGRRAVRLGEQVEVELAEADRITGSLVFALLSHEGKPWPAAPAGPLGGGRGRRRPAH